MLKLVYKTMLVSFLSCSLMMLDFNSKGLMIQSAQAETATFDSAKDTDIMASLTMTGVGLLSSRLYMCKMTPDMMVAAAGGAIFIAGEILSTFKLKEVMKKMEQEIERDAKGNINQQQVEALERLRKSYEEAKSTAGTKKMLQTAAAAAFAAAAVTAYMLVAKEEAALKSCETSLVAAGGTCPGLAPMTATTGSLFQSLFTARIPPAPSAAAVATQTAGEASAQTSTTASTTQATTLASTYAATCAASVGSTPACGFAKTCAKAPATFTPQCTIISPVLKLTTGFCPAPLVLTQNNSSEKNLFNNYSNPQMMAISLLNSILFNPKTAHADLFTPFGIASSAAISYLLYTSKTLGATIDSYLLAPMNRAIIWGVLGALTYAASTSTDNVIKKIDLNIKKIDDILKAYSTISNGSTTTQTSAVNTAGTSTLNKPLSINGFGPVNYSDIKLNGDGSNLNALPCTTGTSPCKPLATVAKDSQSFSGFDTTSQLQLDNILKTADGLSGTATISKATLESASKLAGTANALKAALAKAKKDAGDNLKLKNSKLNIDDASKKLTDELLKASRDGLKNSNATAEGMLASMYGGSASAKSALGKDEVVKDQILVKKSNAGVAGVIDIGASSGAGAGNASLGLESTQTPTSELAVSEDVLKNAASIDTYDLKNDISKDGSSSIFELISNRYQKSGYPRLFKLKEAQPPVVNK